MTAFATEPLPLVRVYIGPDGATMLAVFHGVQIVEGDGIIEMFRPSEPARFGVYETSLIRDPTTGATAELAPLFRRIMNGGAAAVRIFEPQGKE